MKKFLLASILSVPAYAETAIICEKTPATEFNADDAADSLQVQINSRLQNNSVMAQRIEKGDSIAKKNYFVKNIKSISAPTISRIGNFYVMCVTVRD